jgi:hypothetical protein
MQILQQSVLLQAASYDRRQTDQPRKVLALATISGRVRWPAQLAQVHPYGRQPFGGKQEPPAPIRNGACRARRPVTFVQVLADMNVAFCALVETFKAATHFKSRGVA